ncbi:protein FAM219A isoform X2 [Corythoichthys intestinalis]|uniref:protein FAM219A isoform X2 n=1 Tax=Corythoichthys intestinalis TaxID=161448 RepID=UPI0025A63001|nr:protein FAM219A isoform X2 [Corythoichthys intestinalis]
MMEEIDRFQVPNAVQEAEMQAEMQPLDPTSSTTSEADSDTREGEPVTINYKPSPLQMKIEKQRDLARKGSLKNSNSVGSPVNNQPKKNNVMARTRLVVPNKGYSSLDQSPDEKPLVALDTDSDDDFDMSRYSSSGYSSAELRDGRCSAWRALRGVACSTTKPLAPPLSLPFFLSAQGTPSPEPLPHLASDT